MTTNAPACTCGEGAADHAIIRPYPSRGYARLERYCERCARRVLSTDDTAMTYDWWSVQPVNPKEAA
jgi:hypothetical protein